MDLKFPYLGLHLEAPLTYASEGFKNTLGSGSEHVNDMALGLDPQAYDHQFAFTKKPVNLSGFSSSPKGTKRKWGAVNKTSPQGYPTRMGLKDGSGLALGLGPTSSSESRVSSGTTSTGTSYKDNTEDESSMELELGIQLQLGSVKNNSPKKHSADLTSKQIDRGHGFPFLSLSTAESGKSCVSAESDFTLGLGQMQNETGIPINMNNIPVVDEGSTSAKWASGGYIPLIMARSSKSILLPTISSRQNGSNPSLSIRRVSGLGKSPVSSRVTEKQPHQQRSNVSTKTCQFQGCTKGARGASGRCIAHGGGRRCQKDGCNKGAEGRTVYCKAHGGGRRCHELGCTKSAEGKTDFCIAHGGGRRCSHESCDRAARGKSGLCIRHGGGKRCQKEGCTKSAEGYSGLCISHGGGRRCQFTNCTKGAQGSTMYCKAHGGGKRCIISGCNKGAEGSTPMCKGHGGGKRCLFEGGGICTKSVHGGTKFCVAHGGGKRCAVQGCTKSARGRTDYCVRHGGGKRCKYEGCGKSAQGSTDFCKAHGGGKRCQWGVEGSIYAKEALQGKNGETLPGPCDRFARGKTGLCASHSALVQDWRIHGGGSLYPGIGPGLFHGLASTSGTKSQDTSTPSTPSSINLSGLHTDIGTGNFPQGSGNAVLQPFLPHQVLVPSSMKSSDHLIALQMENQSSVSGSGEYNSLSLPEGRVHGGGLMAMLSKGLRIGDSGQSSQGYEQHRISGHSSWI